jgi:hypothetical protein
VSDGETWPEYIAAHLGEPVRNFGIGGYGVYQAYRRMLREEATDAAAGHVILNIFGLDDHRRSLEAWPWLRLFENWRSELGYLYRSYHSPWAHIRLELPEGKLVERESQFRTPESLYKLCDKEFVYELLKDDLIVKFLVTQRGGSGIDLEELESLARQLLVRIDLSTAAGQAQAARDVHLQYALLATMQLLLKARTFVEENRKKFMILLSYDSGTVARACEGAPRADQRLIDFLKDHQFLFVDTLTKHVEDFMNFRLSPRAYVNRYFNGHYKPQGNHFFAFAIKDALVNWLDPKPFAYRRGSETVPGGLAR